jgi:hypothetical protein
MHVTANVASVYETWKTVEQPGDTYVNSPKEKSKEAIAFLTKEVFTTPEWLLDNEILNKISNPVRVGSVANIQARVLDLVFSDRVFNTLLLEENRYGKGNTYSIIELMDDVKAGLKIKNQLTYTVVDYRRIMYPICLLRSKKQKKVQISWLCWLEDLRQQKPFLSLPVLILALSLHCIFGNFVKKF